LQDAQNDVLLALTPIGNKGHDTGIDADADIPGGPTWNDGWIPERLFGCLIKAQDRWSLQIYCVCTRFLNTDS